MRRFPAVPKRPADWLAIAAAVLFAILGIQLIVHDETAVLRLAVLGWPGWPVQAIAAAHLLGAGALLYPTTRCYGATVLALLAAGAVGTDAAYRELGALAESAARLLVAVAVLYTALRRRATVVSPGRPAAPRK